MEYKEEKRICKNCQNDFIIEPEDFNFYEKINVPAPENCPECRSQQRMLYRNFRTLYKRPCSKTGKMVVSVYNTNTPFPVYEHNEWWSDNWDPMDYGLDIDFNKSFFSQYQILLRSVPRINLVNTNCYNSEYSNQINDSKNCYLIFGGIDDEDCNYGHIVWNCRDSNDNLYLFKSEYCYECIDCLDSSKLFYSQECEACVYSIGLFDCRNCLNCIGCVGQVNKSYCIFNKQVSKEEYKDFLEKYPLSNKESIDFVLKERDKLRRAVPQRAFFGSHNNNVSGNHIYNAHNVHDSFDVKGGENSRYSFTVRKIIDSYDISFTGDVSESYQCLTSIGSNRAIGSQYVVQSNDVYYSDNCYNCSNIFGCCGLRKKSHCIFNKQYSKEEYNVLLPKLIDLMKKNNEWGKFPPKELSPFAYNEAIVNEYMPLSKEQALERGFRWQDDIPSTKGQGTIDYSNLPKAPQEYSDRLISEILTCDNCEKNYKLINAEIVFYKRNKLSLPSRCFNCRHESRMNKRNPRTLFNGKCAKCDMEIKTSYNLEDQKIYKIYCEKCYQQEVY